MKKFFALLVLVSALCSISAQRVNETVTMFGKEQITGFTINVDNAPANIVADALADKFQNQYYMKGTAKKGYHVYENQPCSAFGESRYDIYFTTVTVGKKKDQTTQLTLVVSNGNMNCITFANDPRTSRNIVTFLENFPADVEAYKVKLRIAELKNEVAKLKKDRAAMEKDRVKVNDKIGSTNDELKRNTDRIEKLTAEIEKNQAEFNQTHNPALGEAISKSVKEKQSLQKTQDSKQKTLLGLNNDIVKLNKKLEENAKTIEAKEAELKQLEQQQQK
ncbi:MAG: hypothetical protein II120_00930 [Bacteroidales bacterium]|nr:hypothetical protein [Bacteroidales bacterium]